MVVERELIACGGSGIPIPSPGKITEEGRTGTATSTRIYIEAAEDLQVSIVFQQLRLDCVARHRLGQVLASGYRCVESGRTKASRLRSHRRRGQRNEGENASGLLPRRRMTERESVRSRRECKNGLFH